MIQAQQSFSRDIQALFAAGAVGELTDRQLLERFLAREGEEAELAFAIVVERHGPMVLHACYSILRDQHAAEDAFQATFLVLSRKAGSIWLRDSVGPWLYGVASRVAWCARKAAIRRRIHEQKAAGTATLEVDESDRDDRHSVIREELNRLPEHYRLAVMLCDLEGLTQEQAARRLGWPSGTVRSRLARGRTKLRDRLIRRGLAPALVPVGVSLTLPAVPSPLAAATVENAVRFGAAEAATSATVSAVALTKGVTTAMFISKFKLVLGVVLTSAVIAGSTALFGKRASGLAQPALIAAKPQPASQVGPQGVPNALGQPGSDRMSPIAKARLDVAKKIRDRMYSLYQAGECDEHAYLNAQRRYDDLWGELTTKSDSERVRFHTNRVAAWKKIEQLAAQKQAAGGMTEMNLLAIQLDRLEAEDALAKATARLNAMADTAKARLEVAKRIRDAMFKRFTGGVLNMEEYLIWEERYDDVASTVMQLTGGDKIRLLELRVNTLKQVEKVVLDSYAKGRRPQTDVDIIRYYRLGAEEKLAAAKAE